MIDFTFHDTTSAPGASKPLLEEGKRKYGHVPAMYAAMAEAPGLLEAYDKVQELFMASSFTKEEMTVVWQAINVEHGCRYCVAGHSLIADSMGVDKAITRALREGTPLASQRLEALRTFTLKMVRQRGDVTEADMRAFLDAGFTRRNILEVILGMAQKVMSNFTNHVAQTPVDGQLEAYVWEPKSG